MFARLAVAAACSVAALKYAQLKSHNDNINANANTNSNSIHEEQNPKCREDAKEGCQESNREIHTYPATETTQNEAEEEVKRVSSCSPALPSNGFQEGEEQLLLPEFDDLLLGGVEFHSDSSSDESRARRRKSDGGDSSSFKEGRSKVGGGGIETGLRKYDSSSSDDEALEIFVALASRASSPVRHENEANEVELMQLRAIVSELQEKEMRLEAELFEYYGLKEQEQSYGELERQLIEKDAEIEALNSRINTLEEEKRELLQEVSRGDSLKQELDLARAKAKELQRQLQRDAGDTKANLLLLKQQVAALREKEKEREKEEEIPKLDLELERKLQALKELEVEVVELRRLNKELQHEKRELTVKLALADARITELSSISESELVARAQADAASLRHSNQDLSKQVEGLQMNRFCEVEELVYLRWVNACLRYELRNYKAPPGKFTALDLSKSMSPRSQERAKELMLEYAGPDLLEMKGGGKDRDDGLSVPSTPSSDYGDDLFLDGGGNGKASSGSKKSNLIRMLKKWGSKGKDDTHMSHNLSADSSRSNPSRASGGHRRSSSSSGSKGPLEALLSRNTSDAVAITTYGANDWLADDSQHGSVSSSGDLPPLPGGLPRVRTRSEDNSAIASDVAASFHLMSRSSTDISDEKYPAFKDRHKLASAREAAIKERAEHARVEKLRATKSATLKMPEKVALRTTSIEQEATERETSSTRSDPREVNKLSLSITKVEKREPRVSKPPPKPLAGMAPPINNNLPLIGGGSIPIPPPPPPSLPGGPPPPPPPPPPSGLQKVMDVGGQKVRRAPEVVEFYHSLMCRESRRDSATALGFADADVADARSNIVGEIENRSTFLLAVKADVETQGDFVMSLATEVRAAIYTNMDDVVAFVGWLDEELSFLVDERAVLKHFDWPETKADGLREAAFEYLDLKKVESEISSFEDDLGLPCDVALKKMLSLLEKVEQSVYALLRTRDIAIARYKELNIPVYWMLDSGLLGKIKFSAVQLARKYMKRVALELDFLGDSSENEPYREYVLLQAVRFAFRVHQFSGGFDAESMRVFEGLRNRVQARTGDKYSEGKHKAS